jgi:hypothetical protein
VPTLKVEGEIVGPRVGAVRDACAKRGLRSKRPRLDLAAVTYADAPERNCYTPECGAAAG